MKSMPFVHLDMRLPVDDIITRWAGDVFQKVDISPYDCVHVATMRKLGVDKILSADKDFDKISGIQRIDPKSYSTRRESS